MTSTLDRKAVCLEFLETMAVPRRRPDRGVRRGRFGHAGDQAGQLGACYLGGVAPGGGRGRLAGIRPTLPLPPPQYGPLSCPAGVKNTVRDMRMRKNLAQGQLAEAMGVSRQTINSIENERYTPSLPLALALARYFGVTVEEMFDDQGS
jgi:putative transcriptional regulator